MEREELAQIQGAAEFLNSRGLGVTVLPIAGITVEYHIPRTIEAMEAGLFPMRLATLDLDKIDPDMRAKAEEKAQQDARNTVCACCTSPRFVQRKPRGPKFNEVSIDALTPEEFTTLYRDIIRLVERAYTPGPEKHPVVAEKVAQARKALGIACATFGIDPTQVEDWPADRAQKLLDYLAAASLRDNTPTGRIRRNG